MEFASTSNFENLERYFQISPIQTDFQEKQMKIWFEPTDFLGQYILVLRTTEQNLAEKGRVPLEIFPEDIERLIYGYLKTSHEIRIQMTTPELFPIRSVSFKLLSSTKEATQIQTIVHQMNCDLNGDYSPALAIEKTCLILISRILKAINY
jgi:hypothetical protein